MKKTPITKHIFIAVTDVSGQRYVIEIPPQAESMLAIKDAIHEVQMNKKFMSGKMHHDDVCNIFIINGLVARVKKDFKLMYLNPAIQKALDERSKDEALGIIQGVVMDYYKVEPEDTESKARNRDIMMYKEMFCYIALTRYPMTTQEEVARKVGYKTHCTVWHHKRKIEGWVDREYQTVMDDIANIDMRLSVRLLGINKEVKEDFVLKSLEE